jgi:hypothetical protein
MADRAKEYVAYAGLAAGADRIGLPYAWQLAIAAMLLQTVRHMTDAWYGALHDEAARRPAPAAAATGVGARLSQASDRVQADTGSPAYWAKRIVVFPIGERWALIAVLAAVSNGRVALLAVLGWGVLAAAYTLGLRSLRSRSMRVGVLDTVDTGRHRDDGPLVRTLIGRAGLSRPLSWALVAVTGSAVLVVVGLTGALPGDGAVIATAVAALVVLTAGLPARTRHGGALDWLVPAALRAAEYLMIMAVGLIGEVPAPVVFALLFAVALHHYDLTARMEKGVPAGADTRTGTGWDGRVLVLAVVALAGVPTAGMAILTGVVGATFVIGAIAGWRPRRAPSQSGAEGGPR